MHKGCIDMWGSVLCIHAYTAVASLNHTDMDTNEMEARLQVIAQHRSVGRGRACCVVEHSAAARVGQVHIRARVQQSADAGRAVEAHGHAQGGDPSPVLLVHILALHD